MALKTIVKVSSVNNLSDARYCAGMAVDMLGFCFDSSSERYVTPEQYSEIIGWISGLKYVAEFEDQSLEEMNKMLEQYPIHMLELKNIETMRAIKNNIDEAGVKPLEMIFRIDINDPQHESYMEDFQSCVSFFRIDLDASRLEDDTTFAHLQNLAKQYPIMLSEGIDPSNLDKVLQTNIKGIALRGGEETRPGYYKNFDDLADILEALDID